jgi:hypothetical protein
MAENSKENTDKKDEDVAAKNKDLQSLRSEVGILKQFISAKADKEAKETAEKNKKAAETAWEKKRLSKNVKGLGGLAGLQPGLGQQSFKNNA